MMSEKCSGRYEGKEEECPKCFVKGNVYSWLDFIDYDEDEGVEYRHLSYKCTNCNKEWEDE